MFKWTVSWDFSIQVFFRESSSLKHLEPNFFENSLRYRTSRCTTGVNDTEGKFCPRYRWCRWFRWQISHRCQRHWRQIIAFLIEDFSICHRCQRRQCCTLSCKYLHKLNSTNVILRSLGETDSRKKMWSQKSRGTGSLNFSCPPAPCENYRSMKHQLFIGLDLIKNCIWILLCTVSRICFMYSKYTRIGAGVGKSRPSTWRPR